MAISDENDLTISAEIGGALLIEAGGDVRNGDGPVTTGGDLLVDAGGDIVLDDARNDFGGAVGAFGDDITIFESGAVALGPVRASGDLFIMAGAGGTEGAASIIQEGSVTVDDEIGQRTETGAIRVAGDAFFTTGLARRTSLASVADASRDLRLANNGNRFNGKIAATMGKNLVEMKKKSTSRHFLTGRMANEYAAGIASNITKIVEIRTIQNELKAASRKLNRPGVSSVISLKRSSVGEKNSVGLVLASRLSLNPLSTSQKIGKKNKSPTNHANPARVMRLRRLVCATIPIGLLHQRLADHPQKEDGDNIG